MHESYLSMIKKSLNELYKTQILENFLDIKIDELTEGKVICSIKTADKHSNFYGFVHGGTMASVSDIAMGLSCLTLGKKIVTIDMNISYIKNAPIGSIITAVGKVINAGNTIIRSTCEIYHEQQLLAITQASYFITGDLSKEDLS